MQEMEWMWTSLIFSVFVSVIIGYENLALKKQTWQSQGSLGLSGPDLAVDGLYSNLSSIGGECVVTNAIIALFYRKAEWGVDLGEIFRIHHIFIQYITNDEPWDENNNYISHFLGFSVYISNTTKREDGILCFRDTIYTKYTIPNPVNITCIISGRYVIYYNNRTHQPYPNQYSSSAYNSLCEVEVYGCPIGEYGENGCLPCSPNCENGDACDIEDGTCLACRQGYKGPSCEEECSDRKYGHGCSMDCGQCRNGERCHHINGSCPNGCDRGARGVKCDEACVDGYFGYNCTEKCSSNCGIPERCDKATGQCEGGCQIGWKGLKCDTKCDGNNYGQNCSRRCGMCAKDEQCHYQHGTCLNGCIIGYIGNQCKEKCTGNKYGHNCSNSCGFCLEGENCHFQNGTCVGGCKSGYTGFQCKDPCADGNYGNNCQENCSITCHTAGLCDRTTGRCFGGCQDGWKGVRCETMCSNNTYGKGCSLTCGNCSYLYGEQCNHVTGKCPHGCINGYQGELCIEVSVPNPDLMLSSGNPQAVQLYVTYVIPIGISVALIIIAIVVLLIRIIRNQINTSENNRANPETETAANQYQELQDTLQQQRSFNNRASETIYQTLDDYDEYQELIGLHSQQTIISPIPDPAQKTIDNTAAYLKSSEINPKTLSESCLETAQDTANNTTKYLEIIELDPQEKTTNKSCPETAHDKADNTAEFVEPMERNFQKRTMNESESEEFDCTLMKQERVDVDLQRTTLISRATIVAPDETDVKVVERNAESINQPQSTPCNTVADTTSHAIADNGVKKHQGDIYLHQTGASNTTAEIASDTSAANVV